MLQTMAGALPEWRLAFHSLPLALPKLSLGQSCGCFLDRGPYHHTLWHRLFPVFPLLISDEDWSRGVPRPLAFLSLHHSSSTGAALMLLVRQTSDMRNIM